jgi:hypothetical protein
MTKYVNGIIIKEGKFPNSLSVWIPNVDDFTASIQDLKNAKGGLNLSINKAQYPDKKGNIGYYVKVFESNYQDIPQSNPDKISKYEPVTETENDELPF